MPKDLNNITGAVMDEIHNNKIKMRPKIYFVIGSFLAFLGLTATMLISVFLVGLLRFSLRSHGPRGEYRLEQILANFPWWAAVIAILGLVIGLWILRRYDFSYKLNFKVLIVGFVAAIILAGWALDMSGLNDLLFRQRPMQGVMRQYFQKNNTQPNQWRGGWMNNQR